MRVVATLVLLACALVPWASWNERRRTVETRQPIAAAAPDPASPRLVAADLAWLEAVTGTLVAPPGLAELGARLARWRLDEPPAGWALLAEPGRGAAARTELARWLELEPTREGRVEALVVEPAGEQELLLRCDLAGASPAVLPWVAHLLAMPRDGGFLSDPRQVRVERDGAELRARVVVAVRAVGAWRRAHEAALRGEETDS